MAKVARLVLGVIFCLTILAVTINGWSLSCCSVVEESRLIIKGTWQRVRDLNMEFHCHEMPKNWKSAENDKVGKIAVDVSEECGGVFFDNLELEQFDQAHEVRGDVLVEHLSQFEAVILAADHRLHCPKCENVVMIRRFYPYSKHHSAKLHGSKRIEIDECPHCRGDLARWR